MTKAASPATGEVWMANLDPVRGSEQGRTRPIVVFQNPALFSFTSTVLAIPLTTNMTRKGLIGTCFLRAGDGGIPENSIALAFQARALDRTRLTRRRGKLNDDSIDAIAQAVISAFGIIVEP